MKILVCGILAVFLTTANVFANANDDGNAGLDALNSGSYDKAVTLFTRALKSGQLAGDDEEFAYLNRAKAYIGKQEYAKATADLKMALKLNPNDTDAQNALDETQSKPAAITKRTPSAHITSPKGWGMLATLVDRYYWYDEQGRDAHKYVMHYEWENPQQVLRYIVRSKSGKIAVGEYRLDPATGKILEAEATSTATIYGTATMTPTQETEYFYVNGVPVRTIATLSPDGSISDKVQHYVNSAWQDSSTTQFNEVSLADAQNAGFFKNDKKD